MLKAFFFLSDGPSSWDSISCGLMDLRPCFAIAVEALRGVGRTAMSVDRNRCCNYKG